MLTLLVNFNSGQMIFCVPISLTELVVVLITSLHHGVAEDTIIETFIYRPESEDFLEVIEIHPENSIIALSVESDLVSEFISP